ncbi:MAG TPA: MFS transporter [Gammaproteobacteria bacterium]|nr:MFS transporter [Gammaproteobacteria bacterium]HIK69882.1 MFS transporter [Pseudomonadales bacterium]
MSKITKKTLFFYGLTDLPIAMSLFPVMVFIPRFYASDMGVPLVLLGTILFFVRWSDVITDPLMGYISDHTRSRFGRRKIWIVLSTPLMMLSVYQLFLPPEDAGALHLALWSVLLSIAITMMLIPYYAWGAELSKDYNERSRITGSRGMFSALGSLAAQLIPALALLLFGIGGTSVVLQLVGLTMLVLMPICVTLTVMNVPEAEYEPAAERVTVSEGLQLMMSNGPFKRLILAFMIGSIGLNITTPLYIFFIADVLQAEDKAIYMLSVFYIMNILAVPFWVWLAKIVGKHRAYLASFFVLALAHPFYLLLGAGDFWWMLPMTMMTGFAAGGFSQTLPNSMKADVIDLDTLQTGENRAAQFFSAWSFAQKATASLGGVIALFGLSLVGFEAGAGSTNGADELFGLRFLFSTFPSVFFLTGAAIVWNYPITAERHAEIRAGIEEKASGLK